MKKRKERTFHRNERRFLCAMCGMEVELNEARVVRSLDGFATVHWFCESSFSEFVRTIAKEVQKDEGSREH